MRLITRPAASLVSAWRFSDNADESDVGGPPQAGLLNLESGRRRCCCCWAPHAAVAADCQQQRVWNEMSCWTDGGKTAAVWIKHSCISSTRSAWRSPWRTSSLCKWVHISEPEKDSEAPTPVWRVLQQENWTRADCLSQGGPSPERRRLRHRSWIPDEQPGVNSWKRCSAVCHHTWAKTNERELAEM